MEAGTITSYWPAGEKDGDSHVGVDVTGVRLQAVSWLVLAPPGPLLRSGMHPSPMGDVLAPTEFIRRLLYSAEARPVAGSWIPAQGGARLGAPWLLDVLPILPRL